MSKDTHEADVTFIRALAELLRENDLTELQVKRDFAPDDSLNVRVSRAAPAPAAMAPAPAPAPVAVAAPSVAARPQETAAASRPQEQDDPASHPGAVTSPMVGTVFLQAEPGSDPFIKVGDSVSEGQTVMIVEAMKTMNHIPAPRDGVVRRILVEDGMPVEYGAPLLILE